MSLYTVPTTSHPGQARPGKLGEVVGVKYTKAQKDTEGNSPPSFLVCVLLHNSKEDASQDVDNPTPPEQMWFIVREELYMDFTNAGWQTHPQLLAAAAKARSTNNQGKWFKDFVKHNLLTDYNPENSFQQSPTGPARTSSSGRVEVGASAPRTPNASSSRPQPAGTIPAAFPAPPAQPFPLLSPSPGAAGGRVTAARPPAGLFIRLCLARTKFADDCLYRNPPKHPQKTQHTPIFI